MTRSDSRPMPVADQVASAGSRLHRGGDRAQVAGEAARHAHDQVTVHPPAGGRAVAVEQAVHGGDVAEVEQLELGHDALACVSR